MTTTQILLVMTNLPDRPSAERLARTLVENGLAACVSLQAPCTSIYRWKGQVETAEEIPLLIKTREDRYSEVETAIRTQHPYELPEIMALPVSGGLKGYLDWIRDETEATWDVC